MLTSGIVLQNRYQIINRIGGGGMGDVYLAADLHLQNRKVVVKENNGGDPKLFYAEANILAGLHHPNLPRVIDHFIEANNAQYLVMDYIAGQNLEQLVQSRGKLTETEALAWMTQILDAVKYLHDNHIIHRDIKPQNIIITQNGRAVLVDFGIAKVIQPGHATKTGAHGIGSPGYAPLEQYTGGTDERTDVYSLGATLYFALTGIEPPPAPSRAYGKPLESVRAINPSLSVNTESAIVKAMALAGNQRFQNVADFEQALRAQSVTAMPNWKMLGVGAILVALLIFSIALILVFSGRGMPTTVPPTSIALAILTAPSVLPTKTPFATEAPIFRTNTPTAVASPTQTPFVITRTPLPTMTFLPMWTPSKSFIPTATTLPASGINCDDPLARITEPQMNAVIRGNQIFTGTANTQDLSFYKVQYMPDASWGSENWGELYKNANRVQDGKLFEWQTRTVAPGGYWLRLLVTFRDGNYGQPCMIHVTIVP